MEYLVPILAVVVIGGITLLVARRLSGRSQAPTRSATGTGADTVEASPERARTAARRLDEATHRAVYGHIAQGRPFEAVRDYRRATGRGVRDAILDIQSLTLHPQVWSLPVQAEPADDDASPAAADMPSGPPRDPSDGRGRDGESSARPRLRRAEPSEAGPAPDAEPAPGGDAAADPEADGATSRRPGRPAPEELTTLTVPEGWTADPAPEEPPFEVEVMRGEESVRLASQDLPPWLRDQLSAMVRDGNLESAAVQLSSHSSLSVPEAFELLRRMKERREGRG